MEDKNQNVMPIKEANIEQGSTIVNEVEQVNETIREEVTVQSTLLPEVETSAFSAQDIEKSSQEKTPVGQDSTLIQSAPILNQENDNAVNPEVDSKPVSRLADADQVIAEIAPEKEPKPYFVIFLFAALIIFAIILPSVNDQITEFINSRIPISNPTPNPNPSGTGQQGNEEPERPKVDLNDQTVLELGNVNITNFTFTTEGDENFLTYVVTKKDSKGSVEDNMYLELYSAENTLLARAKVYFGNAPVTQETFTLTNYIPAEAVASVRKLSLVEKNENDFTYIELTADLDGKQRLTCTRNRHTIQYTFQDYFLIQLEEKYIGIRGTDDAKYNEELNEYQRKNVELETMEGVSSTIVTSDTGFTITNIFDLSEVSVTSLEEFAYFEGSTIARKVNFEMESMGYTCS